MAFLKCAGQAYQQLAGNRICTGIEGYIDIGKTPGCTCCPGAEKPCFHIPAFQNKAGDSLGFLHRPFFGFFVGHTQTALVPY